jgi:hypothetical protein
MFYKILEKYSRLKAEHQLVQNEESNRLLEIDNEIITKFLNLYDKDVKTIHTNQEIIKDELKLLYKETDRLVNNTKAAIDIYDNFMENLKVNKIIN